MDLTKFNFPNVSGADIAFSTFRTDKELLSEAKKRGFYDGRTPYNDLFSELFFSGGAVTFKKKLDEEFKNSAWKYCRCFMSSFEPKHEEKEAICAMLMSELIETKPAPRKIWTETMGFLTNLISATVKIALTPVALARDVVDVALGEEAENTKKLLKSDTFRKK